MSSIPLPALAVRPQQNDPLEQMGNLMNLKRLMAQQALIPGQQRIQQQTIESNDLANQQSRDAMANSRAIDDAYRNSLKIGQDGTPSVDSDALQMDLAKNGHGAAIPNIMKGLSEWKKSQTELIAKQQEVQAHAQDALGYLGSAMQAANYDQGLAHLLIQERLQTKGIQPNEAQQLQQVDQHIQQNPDSIKQLADNWVAQSPKQQQFLNDQKVALIRAGKPPEGELPLGDKINQLNQGLAQRFQVMNPGKPVPPFLQLQPGSTQKDFDRIDKLMESTEKAQGTKAQQDAINADRQNNRDTGRADKSYNFSSTQLDKVGQPIEAAVQRIGRLKDTLAQGSPQADALVAPELLSVMAGGAGSGLRMNEAEISRIVGGRSNWESLKASANKWSLDPNSANSITPPQRQQIRALVDTVSNKLLQKQQIMDQARQDLINSDDPHMHRKIVFDARNKLTQIDMTSGGVTVTDPRGAIHTFPNQQAADNFKKAIGIK